jgi:stage III sporulation protein AE
MRVLLFCLLLFTHTAGFAAAEAIDSLESVQEELFSALDADELNSVIYDLNREGAAISAFDWNALQKIFKEGLTVKPDKLLKEIGAKLTEMLTQNVRALGGIIALAVLCAALENLELAFKNNGVSKAARSICFAATLVLAVRLFYDGAAAATAAVSGMVSLMNALLPLFLTLLAASGSIAAAGLMSPLMIFAVNSISFIIDKLIVPLLLASAVLECANYFTAPYKLSSLAGFIKKTALLSLTFVMMLFVGVMAVQGTAGGISDGLALRTAKFAASSFIPVVGRILSDTVEVLFSASLMLRSAVGIFGVGAIAALCAAPCLKVFLTGFLLKLSGACIAPLGDGKLADCLDSVGGNLYILAGVMLIAAVLFFLMLVMFILSGTITAAAK